MRVGQRCMKRAAAVAPAISGQAVWHIPEMDGTLEPTNSYETGPMSLGVR